MPTEDMAAESDYVKWVTRAIDELMAAIDVVQADVPTIPSLFDDFSWCNNARVGLDLVTIVYGEAQVKSPPVTWGPFHAQFLVSLNRLAEYGLIVAACADSGSMSPSDFVQLAVKLQSGIVALIAAFDLWPSSEIPPPALR